MFYKPAPSLYFTVCIYLLIIYWISLFSVADEPLGSIAAGGDISSNECFMMISD